MRRTLLGRHLCRAVLAPLLFGASMGVSATFHLWRMDELYSNPVGTVQFLELTALAGGQEFVAGHTLTTMVRTGTAGPKVFTFPTHLPADSAGRRMLIGSQGFAALGIVTPDFIVPDNFFPIANGRVNFAEGADVWEYDQITFCGSSLSLKRDGSVGANSPTNFAGATGEVQAEPCAVPSPGPGPAPTPSPAPTPALNVQALWWRWPAGSENGWGLNVTQQDEKLFATWFTYDLDGSPLWMVMDDMRKVGTNSYFGAVYQTRGSSFSAYDASRFAATPVGSATLSFADANNGSFSYTVNGISELKPITKFLHGRPGPKCVAGAAPAGTSISYQDLWWRSPPGSESGWGINIAHQGDSLFATWFTYDANGSPVWFMIDNATKGGGASYSGTVYRTRGAPFNAYDASRFEATAVGSATFTFTDAANGTFAYTVNAIAQSKPITRFVFASPATTCYFAPSE